jgi:hypothetical protein
MGEFQAVDSPHIPFYTLSLDFIVGLPLSKNDYNACLTVTDKFSKAVKLIPGKDTFDAHTWAIPFFDHVYCEWGMPKVLISDRDPKFLSVFWRSINQKIGARLSLTTAYHPSANGQSERTVQTTEITLRCVIATEKKASTEWDELLPDTQFILNTSPNASTGYTPFQLLYGVRPRDGTAAMMESVPDESADEFCKTRQQIRDDASDSLRLAQAIMNSDFAQRHRGLHDLQPGHQVYLKVVRGPDSLGYRLPHPSVFDPLKIGPFTILEKITKTSFKLDFSSHPHIKIHPVISIAHLEPAITDRHHRPQREPGPVTEIQGQAAYNVDRILKKELRRQPGDDKRYWYYKVRWEGYTHKDDSWVREDSLREDVPELVEQWERQNQRQPRRSKRHTTKV